MKSFGIRASHARRVADGQILVLAALLMFVIIAVVALVIDGGYAWGQQRATQNGTDASAEAGAAALMQHMISPASVSDSSVANAVQQTAAKNNVTVDAAFYTDIGGALLRPDGTTTTDPAQAAEVGGGSIPPCATNCAGPDASGVQASGSRGFSTFFARVIGVSSLTAGAHATAISGYVANPCEDLSGCPLVPVTVPVTVVTCDNQNRPVPMLDANGQPIPYVKNVHYTLPLCHTDPGNVGWLDWTPTAGGTSELAAAIENPEPRYIVMPEWYYVTETGNVNSRMVEDALNLYAGKVIFIPMFDSTCNVDPPGPGVDACPPPDVGGQGQNQWYHLPQFGAFLLDSPKGAYIQGNNSADCVDATGSAATSCLKGMFVDFQVGTGTVGATPPTGSPSDFYGVQLIR